MIADLKAYFPMKNSGVEWLGEVPEHWEVRRNGRLFAQRNETGFAELPVLEVSLRTGVRIRDLENSGRKKVMSDRDKYKRALAGDIAYNMMRMWQGAVGVAPVDGLISPAYVVARPLPGTEARYFEKLFRTSAYMQEVDNYSRGIVKDRNRLYWEDFKAMPACYPPPEEQAAIVRYLDHVDRRVRRLVRAKRKLIALLTEQKQAIIHRAVTRGLDPDVLLKDSGVEWLGAVPEHWAVVRNKNVCRLGTGHTPSRKIAEYWVDCNIPWFTLSDVHKIRNDQLKYVTETENQVSELGLVNSSAVKLPPGTVILSRTASVGFSVILGREMATSQDFMAWTPGERVNSEFLLVVLRAMRPFFRRLMYGSTHNTIYMPDLHAFRTPLPPLPEQAAIVEHLDEAGVDVDTAVSRAQREIELLNEYRTRLIADVVTGTLDVRDASAALPAVDPLDTEDNVDDTLEQDGEAGLDDLDVVPEEAEG